MPGCSGKGERKTDYCYDPTLAESIEATTAPPGTTEETTTSEFRIKFRLYFDVYNILNLSLQLISFSH